MVLCWIENVWSWARHVFMKMVLRIIGSILRRIFVSSTWVTVQRLQDPSDVWEADGCLTIAARSRNLRDEVALGRRKYNGKI